jgi:hypothetical protein
MTKAVWTGAVTAAAVLFLSSPVMADQKTATVTINADIKAKAKLDVSPSTISFDDPADPTTTMTATAPVTVSVKARTAATNNVTLTVQSDHDLQAGSDNIAIGNLSWTAGGELTAGTMVNQPSAASLGSWTGSGNHTGDQTYKLANSWTYNIGVYSATITYTLTAP